MINYRQANETDYVRINDFHNRIYVSDRTIEQFYWEFHNGPDGPSIYIIAEDGDKVVGTNCVIPLKVVLPSGETLLTGKSEDTLVDPDYRGQNIFYDIYQVLFEASLEQGIAVIWGFTSASKPFRKLGFEIPYSHSQSLTVNRYFASYNYLSKLNPANKLIDKLKIAGLCGLSRFKALTAGSASGLSDYRITENEPVTEVSGLLSAVTEGSNLYYIQQSPGFQQWRIYENPNYFKVHTFAFYDREQVLKGLIVLNAHPDGMAYVNQTLFHPSVDDRKRRAMIRYMTKQVFRSGISLIRNWHFTHTPPNLEEIRNYKNAGYVFLEKGVGFVWKPLNTELDPADFYLSRLATQGVI